MPREKKKYTITFFPESRCNEEPQVQWQQRGWWVGWCPITIESGGIEWFVQKYLIATDHVERCPPEEKKYLCPRNWRGRALLEDLEKNLTEWGMTLVPDEKDEFQFSAIKPVPRFYG